MSTKDDIELLRKLVMQSPLGCLGLALLDSSKERDWSKASQRLREYGQENSDDPEDGGAQ